MIFRRGIIFSFQYTEQTLSFIHVVRKFYGRHQRDFSSDVQIFIVMTNSRWLVICGLFLYVIQLFVDVDKTFFYCSMDEKKNILRQLYVVSNFFNSLCNLYNINNKKILWGSMEHSTCMRSRWLLTKLSLVPAQWRI